MAAATLARCWSGKSVCLRISIFVLTIVRAWHITFESLCRTLLFSFAVTFIQAKIKMRSPRSSLPRAFYRMSSWLRANVGKTARRQISQENTYIKSLDFLMGRSFANTRRKQYHKLCSCDIVKTNENICRGAFCVQKIELYHCSRCRIIIVIQKLCNSSTPVI